MTKKSDFIKVYIPKHYKIEELIDPKTFKILGVKAFELFDPSMLWTIDQMRERFGVILINDWLWGGHYKYSGFRPKYCSVGVTYSQHRLGRAFDLKFSSYTPEEIRVIISENPNDETFKYITCIENDTPTWLHIDSRPILDRIRWINP
jgi:hypothetical protein